MYLLWHLVMLGHPTLGFYHIRCSLCTFHHLNNTTTIARFLPCSCLHCFYCSLHPTMVSEQALPSFPAFLRFLACPRINHFAHCLPQELIFSKSPIILASWWLLSRKISLGCCLELGDLIYTVQLLNTNSKTKEKLGKSYCYRQYKVQFIKGPVRQ